MNAAPAGQNVPQHLDIRKYPNRRYYDATRSRHLTLEEIRSLVRDGCDIKVTDSKTGADITAQVLTQIILELETPKLESFPVNMLVQMIRANERVVTDFIANYFQQAFAAYLDYHKEMEERFRQLHTLPGTFNPFAAWTKAMFNPSGTPAAGTASTQKATAAPDNQPGEDTRAMIAALRQEIAALEARLKKRPRRR